MLRNIRLTLAYDGADFHGWQVQPDRRTVQGEVEAAIERLTGAPVRLLSAGRTDAGVHALGQVASFQTAAAIPGDKWRPALQTLLPHDVVIRDSREAPRDFHATFTARSKRYRYIIRESVVDDPFLRRYAWRISDRLDVLAMRAAAESLRGTQDFRCFESHWPNKASSVRTIHDVWLGRMAGWPGWCPQPAGTTPAPVEDGEFLLFEVAADGFLYNMVRAIVGTLVNIGRRQWDVDSLSRIIAAQSRSQAGETAPPQGLYLVSVDYGDSAAADSPAGHSPGEA